MGSRIAALALALLGARPAAAQSPGELARDIWRDQGAMLSSPLRADRRDAWVWLPAALVVGALAPNYNDRSSLDERAVAGIKRDHPPFGQTFRRVTLAGDGRVLFGLAAAGYGAGHWTDAPGLERTCARWLEALADASVAVTAAKALAGRNRPGGARSRFTGPWGYAGDQAEHSSFPSGHATLAFASAAALSGEADDDPRVVIPAYALAGLVGFSRLYVEKHWTTDVVVGAALGHGIGRLVERRRGRGARHAWRWEPVIDGDRAGARWVLSY